MQIHPYPNDKGQPVTILNPSTPTPLSAFDDLNAIALVVPNSPVPERLNGLPFCSAHSTTSYRLAIQEPALKPQSGKKLAAGAVIVEPDGRFWVVMPTNQFGGYQATFPKGRLEAGMTPQATAIKEAQEESGLQVRLIALIGDFERSVSVTRYYLAQRIGGNPAQMGWESQCVGLIPPARLLDVCSHPNDQPIISQALQMLTQPDIQEHLQSLPH